MSEGSGETGIGTSEHISAIPPTQPEGVGPDKPRKKARRGFAAMSAEKQKEIASLGGKAAHAKGTAHEFSPEEARAAGQKGGIAAQRSKNTQKKR